MRREQWVARPVEEVFSFFSSAHNLEELTPPWLNFQILSPPGITIETGAELSYRLRLRGLPIEWTTEIRRWEPPNLFTDFQRKGPYRIWHHTHRFERWNGGTRMSDVVRYSLPLGFLGSLANRLFVRRDVERIFDYRHQKIQQLFGR